MTNTPPDTAPNEPAQDDLPPDVSALLDEASIPGGPYSARPLADRIQLIETASRRVVREVLWDGAGAWAARVFNAVTAGLAARPVEGANGETNAPVPIGPHADPAGPLGGQPS